MKKQINQVKEFNKVFGVKDVSPTLRYEMIYEELDEYYDSANCGWDFENCCEAPDIDKVEQADAIGDMLYLVFGAVIDAGLEDKIEAIFDEIHKSNLSKLEDGKVLRRSDGKVLKGKNYFKPNIKAILDEDIRD